MNARTTFQTFPANRSTEVLIKSRVKRYFSRNFFIGVFATIVVLGGILTGKFTYDYWRENRWIDIEQCRIQECGNVGPSFIKTRIIGGQNARVDEFPYQVALTLKDGDEVFCGGNMISDRWIVTAGHCLRFKDGRRLIKSALTVSVAIVDTEEVEENSMKIEDYYVHPQYDPDKGKMYDIALIKTAKPISLVAKHYTNPICLPYEDNDSKEAEIALVSGFGTTREADSDPSDKLMRTEVKLLPSVDCLAEYFTNFDAASMVCAGDLRGGHDTCQGDSGGPLAIKNENGSYVLKGITSYGTGCGREKTPGVYTKVSHYMMWMCRKMINNGLN